MTNNIPQLWRIAPPAVPKDLQQYFASAQNDHSLKISNFGLLFHRLIPDLSVTSDTNIKKDLWPNLLTESNRIFTNPDFRHLYQTIRKRQELLFTTYQKTYCITKLPLKVAWRLSIGFGTASVLETGITLHRIYGIPYLPGSGIKGVARHYHFQRIAANLGIFPETATPNPPDTPQVDAKTSNKQPGAHLTPCQQLEAILATAHTTNPPETLEKMWQDLADDPRIAPNAQLKTCLPAIKQSLLNRPANIEDISATTFQDPYELLTFNFIFGHSDHRGGVTFFDAFPDLDKPTGLLDLDIINTHYQTYYTTAGKEPPADYHDPIPIYFLALKAETCFVFHLAAKNQLLLEKAREWLYLAAKNHGLGAKTLAGYGELQ